MLWFKCQPAIHFFETLAAYWAEHPLQPGDCLLVSRSVYRQYLSDLPLPPNAQILQYPDYGQGEPSVAWLPKLRADAGRPKRILGIGGGSVLDVAKLLALPDWDFLETASPLPAATQRACPLVLIPTTCGTGSEVTRIAIVEQPHLRSKQGIVHDALFADQAILIPELLQGLSDRVFMTTSLDALTHAMEAFVSPKATPITDLFAVEAIRTILSGFQDMAHAGMDARQERLADFLKASTLAGLAFGQAGVGAVHALAYPLGGVYHVPHGEANYQFLTVIFRLYSQLYPTGRIQTLNALLKQQLGFGEESDIQEVYDELDRLLGQLMGRPSLQHYGMQADECQRFAECVVQTQQRLLSNAYVPMDQTRLEQMYSTRYCSH